MKKRAIWPTLIAAALALLVHMAALAECQQGGYLDEHPHANPDAKFQGVVSNASMNGLNHYSAHWSQKNNRGDREERDLDIKLEGSGQLTITETQSHQYWKGSYQRIGEFLYFEAKGFEVGTDKDIDYDAVGCFRAS
jgi:hypothetical protein